jgi:hypothetical protein
VPFRDTVNRAAGFGVNLRITGQDFIRFTPNEAVWFLAFASRRPSAFTSDSETNFSARLPLQLPF